MENTVDGDLMRWCSEDRRGVKSREVIACDNDLYNHVFSFAERSIRLDRRCHSHDWSLDTCQATFIPVPSHFNPNRERHKSNSARSGRMASFVARKY